MKFDNNRYDVQERDGVKVVTAKFWDVCEDKLGKYMEDTDYDYVVDQDCDFYAPPNCDVIAAQDCAKQCGNCVSEDDIIFKLRKGIFSESEQLGAYEGLVGAAQPTQNRGLASGPKGEKQGGRDWVTDMQLEVMDHLIKRQSSLFEEEGDPIDAIINKYKRMPEGETRGMVWLRSKVNELGYSYETFFADKVVEWKAMTPDEAKVDAKQTREGLISDTSYANQVLSGIAGFFDRYPRIPYGRATAYTERNYETYIKCHPFMKTLASKFKELLPRRYGIQENAANQIDDRYRVANKDTPFTTITVNKNFRTAAHRDAGDLHEGFSNLTVVAKDKEWTGGYLVLPEFRVAVNIRPGDLLLINNHAGIHGNTKLSPPEGKTIEDMERISLVCYFRANMLVLGTKEYEDLRKHYVDSRRLDRSHPEWRNFWNGISPSMWDNQEWYDYLTKFGSVEMLEEYHPNALKVEASLSDFF